MRTYQTIARLLDAAVVLIWRAFILIHELKNIWSKRQLVRSFKLTEEQKHEAWEYWRVLLGHRIPLWWHRLYASYTGHFDARYIPEIVFSVFLEHNASRRADREALDDKSYLAIFAGDSLHLPQEYAASRNGLITARGGGGLNVSAS